VEFYKTYSFHDENVTKSSQAICCNKLEQSPMFEEHLSPSSGNDIIMGLRNAGLHSDCK
jgi:hypothetical protein